MATQFLKETTVKSVPHVILPGLFSLTQTTDNLGARIREELDTTDCSYSNATRYMFTALDKENGTVTCVYTGRSVSVGSDQTLMT